MIKIPETSPCYLTINQSEASPYTATLTANVAFRNPPLKAIWESGSFEHELPVFLDWIPAIGSLLNYFFIKQSVDWFCFMVGGPRLGSVTLLPHPLFSWDPPCIIPCSGAGRVGGIKVRHCPIHSGRQPRAEIKKIVGLFCRGSCSFLSIYNCIWLLSGSIAPLFCFVFVFP